MLSRRGFIGRVVGLLAAPAIVRVGNIMPIFSERVALITCNGTNWIPMLAPSKWPVANEIAATLERDMFNALMVGAPYYIIHA
jgi:hypothetical protein